MEDKTILEELLERSPDERMHKRKMDKAYHLMTMGMRGEADALFDEILAEEPYNRDALTGKKLIARQKAVESRLDNLSARARAALPEARTVQNDDAQPEPVNEAKEAPEREPRFMFLRSRKVKAALIAAFALLVAAAAAFVITDKLGSDTDASACEYEYLRCTYVEADL